MLLTSTVNNEVKSIYLSCSSNRNAKVKVNEFFQHCTQCKMNLILAQRNANSSKTVSPFDEKRKSEYNIWKINTTARIQSYLFLPIVACPSCVQPHVPRIIWLHLRTLFCCKTLRIHATTGWTGRQCIELQTSAEPRYNRSMSGHEELNHRLWNPTLFRFFYVHILSKL